MNPYTGQYITATGAPVDATHPYFSTLGREGVSTAFYGNPRQLFVSVGYKF